MKNYPVAVPSRRAGFQPYYCGGKNSNSCEKKENACLFVFLVFSLWNKSHSATCDGFWKVFKASSDSWQLKSFHPFGIKSGRKAKHEVFLFYTILFLKDYTECIATKRAALSLRSPAVSLSLPLQMNGHPRWQRQAFTGRPLHLHLIFAGSSSANGEARRWLSLERDWPISAMSVREEAGFRGRKRRGKKKHQRLTASLRMWSNTTLWYKKGPCV